MSLVSTQLQLNIYQQLILYKFHRFSLYVILYKILVTFFKLLLKKSLQQAFCLIVHTILTMVNI